MELSVDRILGIIGVVGIVIGIGFGLALDSKSKGEVAFSIGSFIVSGLALGVLAGIALFKSDTQLFARLLLSASVFAVIGILTVEASRWANGRATKFPSKDESPKTETPSGEPQKPEIQKPKEMLPLMEPTFLRSNAEYPPGTVLAGIHWNNRFTELRVFFYNNSSDDYHDLDFKIIPDEPIAAIAQVTNLPDVSFSGPEVSIRQELIVGATGQRIANPLVLVATNGGYRIRCKTLPRASHLEILLGTARIVDFSPPTGRPSPKPHGGIFEENYALRVAMKDKTMEWSNWYGRQLNSKGYKNEGLYYQPQRMPPTKAKVDGRYKINEEERVVCREFPVKDIILDFLKKGLPKP